MKKFFKSLAIVLALTLVIGTIPASAATVSQSKKEVSVWVGKTAKVADCLKDFDSKTMKLTSESANAKIASVKSNTITGVAGGETTVTFTVANSTKGTVLLEGKIAVTVKNHATKDTLRFVFDAETYAVGATAIVNLPTKDEAGKKNDYDTDRTLACVGPNGKVAVTPTKNAREWSVKFDVAGDYKFTATANDGAVVNEKTITVGSTAASGKGIKQDSSKSFQITFSGEAKLAKEDFKPSDIYWELQTSSEVAVIPFSAVAKVENKDNVATVTMYTAFKAGTTYKVKVAGQEYSFVGAKNSYKDVDRIEVKTYTAVVEKETEIVYAFYNVDGVDITTSAKTSDVFVSIEQLDSVGSVVDGEKPVVTFDTIGQQTDVRVVFSYWDDAAYDTVTKSSETSTIVCVAGEPRVEKSHSYTVTTDSALDKVETKKTWFAIGDETYLCGVINYNIKDANGRDKDLFNTIQGANFSDAYAYSADNNVAMVVNGVGSTVTGFQLEGIQEGDTAIIVCHTDDNGEEVVDMVCPITVKAARKATYVDATVTKITNNQSLLNCNNAVADKLEVAYRLKDQYQEYITDSNVYIKQSAKTSGTGYPEISAFTGGTADNDKIYKWTIDAANVTAAQNGDSQPIEKQVTIEIGVTGNNSLTKAFSFKVKDVAYTTPDKYILTNDTATLSTDLAAKAASNAPVAEIYVKALKNGYYIGKAAFNVVKEVSSKTTATYGSTAFDGLAEYDGTLGTAAGAASTGNAVFFEVTVTAPGNTNLVSSDGTIVGNTAADGLNAAGAYASFITKDTTDYEWVKVVPFNANKKLPAGAYQFNLYKVEPKENGCTVSGAGSVKLTVNNTQNKPTISQTAQTSSKTDTEVDPSNSSRMGSGDGIKGVIADCFELKFNDKKENVTVDNVKYVKNRKANGSTSVFVYSVDVTCSGYFGTVAGTYKFTVPVNKLISLS